MQEMFNCLSKILPMSHILKIFIYEENSSGKVRVTSEENDGLYTLCSQIERIPANMIWRIEPFFVSRDVLFLELTFPFGSNITQQTQVSTQKNLFVFDDLDNIPVVPTLGTLDPVSVPAQVSVTTSPTSPITIPIPPEVVFVPPAATHSPPVRRSTRGSRFGTRTMSQRLVQLVVVFTQ
ncbi:hypothetical protein H5410_026980 [Solanum commersonii]|uniref:Uncharacterized protein n=1 Tax=Solanum commersonii TaxID=4109 RepID=A0A9J5Z0G8_SOLCO|nr:hypothetical protein H5410_026980 [Solanum commersonii]